LSLEKILGKPKSPLALAAFLIALGIGSVLAAMWAMTFPKQTSLDILGDYWLFVTQRGIHAFLGYGPDNRMYFVWIGYILLALGTSAGKVISKIEKTARNPVAITNLRFWIVATGLTFFVVTFDGAANFYNWYDPNKMIAYGVGGIDAFTHSLAGITFGLLLGPYNWEVLLQSNRRTSYLILSLTGFALQAYWEWRENMRPEVYLNPILNSYQDAFVFMTGLGFALFLYEELVEELGC